MKNDRTNECNYEYYYYIVLQLLKQINKANNPGNKLFYYTIISLK